MNFRSTPANICCNAPESSLIRPCGVRRFRVTMDRWKNWGGWWIPCQSGFQQGPLLGKIKFQDMNGATKMENGPSRAVFDVITDFLASDPPAEEILAYRLPAELEQRALELLARNNEDALSSDEEQEMYDFMRVD